MPLDIAHTVCPHDCPSACALDVERIDDHTIGKVHGAKGNRYTAGVVCAKVGRYAERVHHPDRLTKPLRRTASGFEEISWDAALDEVAEAFLTASQKYGSETVWPYYYAGTMGLLQRDGINRLRNVMGYSRQHNTICSALSGAGWMAGIGAKWAPDTIEIAEADLAVVWGGNPVHTQVNLMSHIARARKERGAPLVVVDPYRGGTAQVADWHLPVRPGTDGALACGMMHVMFRDGLADREYMAKYADDPEGLEAHLKSRTPEWAAGITGLDAADIEKFAHMMGSTPRTFMRIGYGLSRSRNGAANFHAVTCLPTVTGAWQHRGGGAVHSNSGLYRIDMSLIEAPDRIDAKTRVLDMSRIGPVLTNDPRDIGDGPPVTAMIIQNTNPMSVAPELGKVKQGFERDDLFVCVHEQFMTETAAVADIVLPATTFLEHDDIYISLGHSHLQIGPKAIEPLGAARCNHDVLCGLATRLGAEHPAFEMSSWELIDATLTQSGYPGADAFREKRWIDCQPAFEEAHFLNGFGHADGKFHFSPDWAELGPQCAGMPAFPDHYENIDEATEEHPYRMVTAPSRQFLNSSFNETETSRKREGRPTVKVHPDTLSDLGLAEGDRVRLGNKLGSLVIHAEADDGQHPGVVIVEGIWPNASFEEGIGINLLVSAEAGTPNGGAAFHDTAVWMRPA